MGHHKLVDKPVSNENVEGMRRAGLDSRTCLPYTFHVRDTLIG